MLEALYGLKQDSDGYDDERHCIYQGGQDTNAVIAKGLARIRGSFCLDYGKPGQAKRKDIGYDMTCIRKQGK